MLVQSWDCSLSVQKTLSSLNIFLYIFKSIYGKIKLVYYGDHERWLIHNSSSTDYGARRVIHRMKNYKCDLYVIVNLTGDGGKAKKTYARVREILNKNGVNFKTFASRYKGDVKLFVEKLTDRVDGMINIAVIGGDGTINGVINGIKDFSRTRIGIIPIGSGNDFARGLGLPKETDKAVGRILRVLNEGKNQAFSCRVSLVDVGLTTVYGDENVALMLGKAAGVTSLQRRFGISSGIGLDALVCKKLDGSKIKAFLKRFGMGSLSYIVMTVISLFTMEKNDVKIFYTEDVEDSDITAKIGIYDKQADLITVNETVNNNRVERRIKKLIFFAAMNMKCEGGGVPMAPKADYSDGQLSCTLAYDVQRWKSFFILPVLVMAKHEKMKSFMLFNDKKVELVSDKEMVVHVDGEYGGESKHVSFEILPEKLMVITG